MAVQPSSTKARCVRIKSCALRASDWKWPLAHAHAAEIETDWQRRQAQIPAMFNGVTYLTCSHTLEGAAFGATLFKSDFRTLLYWRARSDAAREPVRETFGSSLIRSAEGHLLMGQQGPGQLNSGRIYPPGGLIDGDDVRADGAIDIDASIARELGEETGLSADDLERVPGYLVVFTGLKIAIGIEWRSALPAAELRARILEYLRHQPEPELADIVSVASRADIDEMRMPPHALEYARTVLSA
jgi:8-oxo-dGTP pyrophosphatase MutT (NUDIX family)